MAVEKDRRRLSGYSREILLAAIVVAIIVFAALNSVRFFTRIDLTESKAYSISEVSRSLFEEIPEEVLVTYYVSERLQERFPQPQEIVDLLGEYAASSRGTIRLRVVDPGAEEAALDAEGYGVAPQQLQVSEEAQQTYALVYSGIVVSYLDRFETIPFIFSTSTLEYEVTSTIRELVDERTRDLRFLIADPETTLDADFSFAASQLAREYDVRELAVGEPVPDDVDVLIAVGPQRLPSEALYHIDQYLVRGGSVLMAVDSVQVDLSTGLSARSVAGSGVFPMLSSYGVTVHPELVLDEAFNQIVVQEAGRGFNVQRYLPYEHWITVLEQYTSPEHPVTARFTGLDLYWPGWLDVEAAEGLDADPDPDPDAGPRARIIVASTPPAWLLPEPYLTNPQQSDAFRSRAAQTRGQYGLVAVVTGMFESHFPGSSAWPYTPESGASGRLMVVSDENFISNRFIQATQSGYNLGFLESAAQWLSNDEDLLSIRTRSSRDLRLNNIDDPAAKQAVVTFSQAVNIYVIPAIVVVAGVSRFVRRRRRAVAGRKQ